MSMPITAHFALDEFASADGVPYPAEWIASRLRPLCLALEVIRDRVGKPVIVTPRGGYRTQALNRKIGGARLSQHVEGRAADFVVRGMSAQQVHDLVIALHRDGAIKIGGCGAYPGFVHVDVRPGARLVRWGGSRQDG